MVSYTLRKKGQGLLPMTDQRGEHTKLKTSDNVLQGVRKHIRKFPTVESHYCRQSTKRRYLDSTLSVIRMYELYQGECSEAKRKCASLHVYRHVFNTEFNLVFHKPKED